MKFRICCTVIKEIINEWLLTGKFVELEGSILENYAFGKGEIKDILSWLLNNRRKYF